MEKDLDFYSKVLDVAKFSAKVKILNTLFQAQTRYEDDIVMYANKTNNKELQYMAKFFIDKMKEHNAQVRSNVSKIENIRIRNKQEFFTKKKSTFFLKINFEDIEKIVSNHPEEDASYIAKTYFVR